MNEHDFMAELKGDLEYRLRWRKRACRLLTFGQHLFGEPWRVDVGPIGFVASEETLLGWHKQCRICYKVCDSAKNEES
jgi:hypothetical protein